MMRKWAWLVCLLVLSWSMHSWAGEKKWSVSLYGGQFTDSDLVEILYRDKFKHGYVAALALAREVWRSKKWPLGIEIEGQAAKNWGYAIYEDDDPSSSNPGWDWAPGMSYADQNSGWSTHEEFNLVASLRWHRFPWDRYLDTSLAFGEGLSYATKDPPVETDPHGQLHGSENERYKVSRFLNYLMLEFDFTHPSIQPWSIFWRVHHRSGIFGQVNGVDGGSNFMTGGIRYRFDLP